MLAEQSEANQADRRIAQTAMEEAKGELNVLSGSIYAPELEVSSHGEFSSKSAMMMADAVLGG